MNDQSDKEVVVIGGLVQDPRRLVELQSFKGDWFTNTESRVVFMIARQHHTQAASSGRIRYANAEVIERVAAASFKPVPNDKAKTARNKETLAAVRTLLDDISGWDVIDDHEFRDAIDAVRKAALDRRARRGLGELVDKFGKHGAQGVYQSLVALLGEVSSMADVQAASLLATDVANVLVDYETTKRDPKSQFTPTPHPRLTKVTGGGGKAGRLWIVAAYAKEGKTQECKELIYHASTQCGRGCVVITSEQTRSDVRLMLAIRHSHKFIPGGLPFQKVISGQLSPQQEDVLRQSVNDLKSKNYGPVTYWQAPGGTTMSDVRAFLEACARRHPVDVAMLDHTMLFQPTNPTRSEVGDLTGVIREAKQIALDFNGGKGLWMVAAHQIKREGYEKALTRGYYVASDLAGSSEAERSADVVMWLLRTDDLRDIGEIRLGVAVDRWGPGETKGWHACERFSSSAILNLTDGNP